MSFELSVEKCHTTEDVFNILDFLLLALIRISLQLRGEAIYARRYARYVRLEQIESSQN